MASLTRILEVARLRFAREAREPSRRKETLRGVGLLAVGATLAVLKPLLSGETRPEERFLLLAYLWALCGVYCIGFLPVGLWRCASHSGAAAERDLELAALTELRPLELVLGNALWSLCSVLVDLIPVLPVLFSLDFLGGFDVEIFAEGLLSMVLLGAVVPFAASLASIGARSRIQAIGRVGGVLLAVAALVALDVSWSPAGASRALRLAADLVPVSPLLARTPLGGGVIGSVLFSLSLGVVLALATASSLRRRYWEGHRSAAPRREVARRRRPRAPQTLAALGGGPQRPWRRVLLVLCAASALLAALLATAGGEAWLPLGWLAAVATPAIAAWGAVRFWDGVREGAAGQILLVAPFSAADLIRASLRSAAAAALAPAALLAVLIVVIAALEGASAVSVAAGSFAMASATVLLTLAAGADAATRASRRPGWRLSSYPALFALIAVSVFCSLGFSFLGVSLAAHPSAALTLYVLVLAAVAVVGLRVFRGTAQRHRIPLLAPLAVLAPLIALPLVWVSVHPGLTVVSSPLMLVILGFAQTHSGGFREGFHVALLLGGGVAALVAALVLRLALGRHLDFVLGRAT